MTTEASSPELAEGLHKDIPESIYHALKYVSNSYLSRLDEVPAMVKVPYEETAAMAIGTAFHTLILQPERFDELVAVAPVCDKRTKEGKATYADFMASCGDKSTISPADMETVKAMRESVYRHPAAKKILSAGIPEQTVIWQDEETKLMCKSRIDFEPEGNRGVLVDLKKTKSCEQHKFLRSVQDYGYARQAAMYLAGRNITSDNFYDAFLFITCEDTAPYRVEVYNMTPQFIKYGLSEFRRLIRLEEACRRDNHWPHYKNPGIWDMDCPSYLTMQTTEIPADFI